MVRLLACHQHCTVDLIIIHARIFLAPFPLPPFQVSLPLCCHSCNACFKFIPTYTFSSPPPTWALLHFCNMPFNPIRCDGVYWYTLFFIIFVVPVALGRECLCHMFTCMHASTHLCAHIHTCVHTYMYTFNTYTSVCIHTCTHCCHTHTDSLTSESNRHTGSSA